MKRIYYGWVVVGISFWIMSIDYAIWYAFPLFYVEILKEFDWTRAQTALIYSIGAIVYGIGSAVGGVLLDRFGPRKTITLAAAVMAVGLIGCNRVSHIWHFYIFWGGMVSLGVSTAGFVPLVALVSKWFTRRRATAVGIAQAGGRESFLMTPLIQLLILALGWRTSLLALAAAAAVLLIIPAQFLRHSPEDMGLLPDGDDPPSGDDVKDGIKASGKEPGSNRNTVDSVIVDTEWVRRDWTLRNGLRQYRFWALFAALFSIGLGYGIVMTHQVAFMVDIGFTAMFASLMLLLYGIFCMGGRLSGFLSDILGREVTYTMGCGGVIISFLLLILAGDTSHAWMLYIYAVCFGFFSGIISPAYAATAADIFIGKHFGAILGAINMGYGFGNSLGAWLGGYIFDTLGSYSLAFAIAIGTMVSASIFIWISSPRKIRLVDGRLIKNP